MPSEYNYYTLFFICAKIRKIFDDLTVERGDLAKILAEVTTFDSVKPRRAKGFTARL